MHFVMAALQILDPETCTCLTGRSPLGPSPERSLAEAHAALPRHRNTGLVSSRQASCLANDALAAL